MLQLAGVVPQAQQERSDQRARPVLVPAEARHHAIGGAQMLDLGHLALAGQVAQVVTLGHHAVQPGALEHVEPFARDLRVAGRRRQQDRFGGIGHDGLQGRAPLVERSLAQVGCRRSARQSKATNDDGVSAPASRPVTRRDGCAAAGPRSQASRRARSRSRRPGRSGRRASRSPGEARSAPGSIGPAVSGPAIAGRAPGRRGRRGPGSHPTSARSASRRRRAAREWAWPASARWEEESGRP